MFTDIKGYTKLTSKDEMLALSLVDKKRSILEPLLKTHKGTFVKEMGDGTVTYFEMPSQATDCAIKLQEQVYDDKNLNIRIGIHYGDTIIKNKDVFGDTVNIASRIESLAIAGGVFISKEARDKIKNLPDNISLGLQAMKGVGRLIEVYGLKGEQLSTPNPKNYEENKINTHSDKEIPSIAILPFKNKGKKEDDFYAYGIIADLITDVTSAGIIKVASKEQIEEAGNLSIDKLAKKLFVRYIVMGDLWKIKNKFQLSVEIYDTKDKTVIWSDNWQEDWENISTIKSNLSDGILKTINTKNEIKRKLDSENPKAYEYYLRAKYQYLKRNNMEDTEVVRGLLKQATDIDDNLLVAKTLLGNTYLDVGEYDKAMEIYNKNLENASRIDNKFEICNLFNCMGVIHEYKGEYDTALDYHERSLKARKVLDDKCGISKSLLNIGVIYLKRGDYSKALVFHNQSIDIFKEIDSKLGIGNSSLNIASIYLDKNDLERSLIFASKSLVIYEEIGDKGGAAYSLDILGSIYTDKNDFDNAFDYYSRSFEISKSIKNMQLMGTTLLNLGMLHIYDYDKKLDYYLKALSVYEKIKHKSGVGQILNNIGTCYKTMGDYERALDYFSQSLSIFSKLNQIHGLVFFYVNIGETYRLIGQNKKAIDYFKKSQSSQMEIGFEDDKMDLMIKTNLFLSYQKLNYSYKKEEIYKILKGIDNEIIEYELNYTLYQLLEEKSYLEIAYMQVQEKLDNMKESPKRKFLKYPIPEAIIKGWKKI